MLNTGILYRDRKFSLLSTQHPLTPPAAAPFRLTLSLPSVHLNPVTARQAGRGQRWWKISCLPGVHVKVPGCLPCLCLADTLIAPVVHESTRSQSRTKTDRPDGGTRTMLISGQILFSGSHFVYSTSVGKTIQWRSTSFASQTVGGDSISRPFQRCFFSEEKAL